MEFDDWFIVYAFGGAAAGASVLLRPLWLLARRRLMDWVSVYVWGSSVVLMTSAPAVLLLTDGQADWYTWVVVAAVLTITCGYAWTRRRLITGMLRAMRADREQ